MTLQEAREKAEINFSNGFNCSQSVLLTFCEQFGVDKDVALKMSQPFGAGFSRLREVCGCISGLFLLVGLARGTSDPGDKKTKDEVYGIAQCLAKKFSEKNKSIICRELLGLVPLGQSENALANKQPILHAFQDNISSERTPEYYKVRPCKSLVGDAAEIFQEWLDLQN